MKTLKTWAPVAGAFLFLYCVLAWWVFAVRHPWTTTLERIVYMSKAVTFQKVPYKDMRPRG